MAQNLYSRIELNLLPPEMRPRPAVRYTALVNAAVITATAIFIGFNVWNNVTSIIDGRMKKEALEVEIQQREAVRKDYNDLKQIEFKLTDYGRIITMASADYVDMPVVLARLSDLLPEGVYLSRVTNQGSRNRGNSIQLAITLRSASRDEELLLNTLTNLKRDSILSDCYMRSADLTEFQLSSLQDLYQAQWEVTTPDETDAAQNQEYEFEVLINVDRVLPADGLATVADESEFFKGFTLNAAAATEGDGGAVAGSQSPPASNAPGDVQVEATN